MDINRGVILGGKLCADSNYFSDLESNTRSDKTPLAATSKFMFKINTM